MRRGLKAGWLVMMVLACPKSLVFADLAAIVSPGAITSSNSGAGQSIGWRFFVDQEITITRLGLYDAGDNGLADTHVMGLWRVKKTGGLRLERWVSVSGNGDLKTDHHVYASLDSPFTIVPDPEPYYFGGVPYYERWVVGAWNPLDSTDSLILRPPEVASFPIEDAGIIRFQNYVYKSWSSYPDTALGDAIEIPQLWYAWGSTSSQDHFGVNFEYTAAAAPVPVPGAVLLGLIGLGYAGWRCRRQTT